MSTQLEYEVLSRCRRIETKLTKLAEGLDITIASDEDSVVLDTWEGGSAAIVLSMDVSVSAILRVARKGGLHGKPVPVVFNNKLLFILRA
jgi:hypothetical protein